MMHNTLHNRHSRRLQYHFQPHDLPSDFAFYCEPEYVFSYQPLTLLHSHNVLEIGYCYQGDGVFAVGNQVVPCRKGCASIIAPQRPHYSQARRDSKTVWQFAFLDPVRLLGASFPKVHVLLSALWLANSDFSGIADPATQAPLCQAVKDIIEEGSTLLKHHQEMVCALLLRLLILLERTYKRRTKALPFTPEQRARLVPAVEHIAHHYAQRITVPKLAQQCNMGIRNFTLVFRQAFGKSPQQYLTTVRIAMACTLLRNTPTPITAIALDCGFPTFSSFSRQFRMQMGMPPREYRRGKA